MMLFLTESYYFYGLTNCIIFWGHSKYLVFTELKGEKIVPTKLINEFFRGYSQLLYRAQRNDDLIAFKHIYTSFNNLLDKYYDLPNDYRDTIVAVHRRINFAIYAWLWLYNKQTNSNIDKYLEIVDIDKTYNKEPLNANDLLDDLLYYNSEKRDTFGWNRWHYKEREEGKVYSSPQPIHWLTFAFVLANIQEYRLYNIDINKIENHQTFYFLYDKISFNIDNIFEKISDWKPILWKNKQSIPDDNEIQKRNKKLGTTTFLVKP